MKCFGGEWMLKLQSTNFANFKKLWFVSALILKSTRLYLTEYMCYNTYAQLDTVSLF